MLKSKKGKIQMVMFQTRDGERHIISIETVRRADGTIGGQTLRSLLMTQDLTDFRVNRWNDGIDMLESMMIIHACNGVNIETEGYIAGVKCYVESLRNRLF